MSTVDALVVGSGPNGLVAANLLADRGWSVHVLEAQPTVGGAVASDTDVHPGFVHDTFSAFYPLAAASPTIQALELERHGLSWTRAPAVYGTPRPDGSWALMHDDVADTARSLDQLATGDGQAWLDLVAQWEKVRPQVLDALLTPFPPVRAGVRLGLKVPSAGGLSFVRMLLQPALGLAQKQFRGESAGLLLAGNAGHADIPVTGLGSGLFGWLLTMLGQSYGFPVPSGGAGNLTQAMATRLRSLGGEITCGQEVSEVLLKNGRAVGVRTRGGEVLLARKAVLVDVPAPSLYGHLIRDDQLPATVRRGISEFTWDPGTVKVDFALDAPIPWASKPERSPGTVHVVDSLEDLASWNAQLDAGFVPANPFLLFGQMTTSDPSRSPAGTESAWAYTHVPQQVRDDAGDGGITGSWDESERERFADRMQARIETYAPGFGSRIVARRVLGPRELQQRNQSLVNGALSGGTNSPHQQLVFRPIPGLGRAETPFKGLYLASSSAHPGGGVHGACGANAARAAVAHDRLNLRSKLPAVLR